MLKTLFLFKKNVYLLHNKNLISGHLNFRKMLLPQKNKNFVKKFTFSIVSAMLFILFLFSGCMENPNKNNGKEPSGVISYKIMYVNNTSSSFQSFMPKHISLTFNERYTKFYIKGIMGMIDMTLINDNKKNTSTAYLTFIDKKYKNTCDINLMYKRLFSNMEDLDFKETGFTDSIAGVSSKLVEVTEFDNEQSFVYYTEDLKISEPNKNTPYKNIPGVLLEYEIEIADIRMHLIAEEIILKEVSDEEFEVKDKYKNISTADMNKIITEVVNQ